MYRFLCAFRHLGQQRRAAFALLLAATAALTQTPVARAQAVSYRENPAIGVTVTSFETSTGNNGWRYVTTAVHLENRTKQPIILGAERGKISSSDDRHNRYAVLAMRGLGEVAGTRVDPNCVIPAGGGRDALFEMRWRGDRGSIFGTVFDLTLPVRVILPLEGGQYKLGTEHIFTFTGLKAGHVVKPKETPPLPENTVNAGPFTMQITRMTPTMAGNRRYHSAALAARIQNTSSKPIILAYEGSSSYGIDDQGNRYGYGNPGSHDTSISGIGMVTSIKADPQFVLAPGESRDVQFGVIRKLGRETMGTQLTYHVALVELEVLPGNQVRTTHQYSLSFPRMSGLN